MNGLLPVSSHTLHHTLMPFVIQYVVSAALVEKRQRAWPLSISHLLEVSIHTDKVFFEGDFAR